MGGWIGPVPQEAGSRESLVVSSGFVSIQSIWMRLDSLTIAVLYEGRPSTNMVSHGAESTSIAGSARICDIRRGLVGFLQQRQVDIHVEQASP